MVELNKPIPRGLLLKQARERLDVIKQYTGLRGELGPIDPQFGYAISAVIHDAVKEILTEKRVPVRGRLLYDYGECVVRELGPPQLTIEEATQIDSLNTDYTLAVNLGVRINQGLYIDAAERFINWAAVVLGVKV